MLYQLQRWHNVSSEYTSPSQAAGCCLDVVRCVVCGVWCVVCGVWFVVWCGVLFSIDLSCGATWRMWQSSAMTEPLPLLLCLLPAHGIMKPASLALRGLRCFSSAVSPFHLAVPVHNLDQAKQFYGEVMGLPEGRSSTKWQDYNLFGNQLVAHWVGEDYKAPAFTNPVDGDEVPVPHFGIALTVDQFHTLSDRLRQHNISFIIEPHLRFEGQPGEQWTMFFRDPSGNHLEFKAMTNPGNLFVKYNVAEG